MVPSSRLPAYAARLSSVALILTASCTLLSEFLPPATWPGEKFLVRQKCRFLFSSGEQSKPGPKKALKSSSVMVIMDQYSRRIIGFTVHRGDVGGEALSSMFREIVSNIPTPKYLSLDNYPFYRFDRWAPELEAMMINPIYSISLTPISHPFVERLIGTTRRVHACFNTRWHALPTWSRILHKPLHSKTWKNHQNYCTSLKAGHLGKSQDSKEIQFSIHNWRKRKGGDPFSGVSNDMKRGPLTQVKILAMLHFV